MAGKPGWYTLAANVGMVRSTEWTNDWAPLMTAFETALDTWLTPYLSTEVVTGTGETLVISRYTIPATEVKSQLNAMLSSLMNNSALLALIREQATSGQISLYLQPSYLAWYQQVVDAMPMEGDIVLERTTTPQGQSRGYLLDLQVGSNKYQLNRLTLSNEGEETEYTLYFADKTMYLSVTVNDADNYSGLFQLTPAEGEGISASYSLAVTQLNYTDTDGRHHEEADYQLTAEPLFSQLEPADSAATYVDFGDVNVHVITSFYSKSGDSTPVTASVSMDATVGSNLLQLAVTLKSASPWKLPEMPTGSTKDLSAMTAKQRSTVLNNWISNGLTSLSLRQPEEPEAATTTDLGEGSVLTMEPAED